MTFDDAIKKKSLIAPMLSYYFMILFYYGKSSLWKEIINTVLDNSCLELIIMFIVILTYYYSIHNK